VLESNARDWAGSGDEKVVFDVEALWRACDLLGKEMKAGVGPQDSTGLSRSRLNSVVAPIADISCRNHFRRQRRGYSTVRHSGFQNPIGYNPPRPNAAPIQINISLPGLKTLCGIWTRSGTCFVPLLIGSSSPEYSKSASNGSFFLFWNRLVRQRSSTRIMSC
jgi:hypothetical protein